MNETLDTAAANDLRNFALAAGEIAVAHVISQALNGDEVCATQVENALSDIQYLVANGLGHREDGSRMSVDEIKIEVLGNIETTRPGGAIARSFQV